MAFDHGLIVKYLQSSDANEKSRALQIAAVEKPFYSKDDIRVYENIIQNIEANFQKKGTYCMDKIMFSSKEKEVWVCSCGSKNDFDSEYCSKCKLDIYGFSKDHVNPEIKKRIEELGWIYHAVGMTIPHNKENLWSGHFFPFLDSWEELQVSFTQICFGLYKQAFVSLRGGLELGMLSVYFNINDDGHNTVRDWLHSIENTPRTGKIWKILRQNKNIQEFDKKHNLEQVHNDLGYLHNYVHTNGAKYSNRMGLLKTNSQTFENGLILKWLKYYTDIISLVSTLHLLKNPISVIRLNYSKKFGIEIHMFGGLEENNIDKIASLLPRHYLEDVELIAKGDPATQKIFKEISALPDMTEEQVEEQIINSYKWSIENGEGFNLWLEHQRHWLKALGQDEFDEKMQNQIEFLMEWATEKDFLESKPKRMGWNTQF